MNDEIEKIKETLRKYLGNKGIQIEGQYFILKSLLEELWDEIQSEDDEEPEEDIDDLEDMDNTDETEQDLDKPEEDIDDQPQPQKQQPSDHGLKVKELLKNPPQRSPLKVKKND